MRATTLWTINDFPVYANLSGWSTKETYACLSCGYDTSLEWLQHSGKFCYMGHRRWLEPGHRYRKDKQSFDGTEELRSTPLHPSGHEVLRKLEKLNDLCSKVFCESYLELLESRATSILCEMEKIFPPAFFTVMVHLIIHLAYEAKVAGLVIYRRMYTIERFLLTLKFYMGNRACPEGSIAEGYLANECLTFCSRYLEGAETSFNRPNRNEEGSSSDVDDEDEPLFKCVGRPLGRKRKKGFNVKKRKRVLRLTLDSQTLAQIMKRQNCSRRLTPYELQKKQSESFNGWFRKHVALFDEQQSPIIIDRLKWLARGPFDIPRRYTGYITNEFRFHTKSRNKWLKTQNSGIVVTTKVASYASLRDVQPVERKLIQIEVVRKVIKFGFTLVNFSHLVHTGTNLTHDPLILASQAKKLSKELEMHDTEVDDPNSGSMWVRSKVNDGMNVTAVLENEQVAEDPIDEHIGDDIFLTFGNQHKFGYIRMVKRKRYSTIKRNRTASSQSEQQSSPSECQPPGQVSKQQEIPLQPLEQESTEQDIPLQPQDTETSAADTLREHEQVTSTNDKDGQIVVNVNAHLIPVGEAACKLTRFVGTIVRSAEYAPLTYTTWSKISNNRKEEIWKEIKSKFAFLKLDSSEFVDEETIGRIKTWALEDMYSRVHKTHFLALAAHWKTDKAKTEEANGVQPSGADVYVRSRTRKDGSIVNVKASNVMAVDAVSAPEISPNKNNPSSESTHQPSPNEGFGIGFMSSALFDYQTLTLCPMLYLMLVLALLCADFALL
ncbi:Transposon, En/Spm-like protein [Corchorus capsularis]|uniref:Transposon, En/Spm-like protein n=1 Tax=Corchorus capsularis TaxID=210143 RepID=A0A1R3JH62_COCAP|nr:Transposon, En/Spm-like protein [Corchorus capsularis]